MTRRLGGDTSLLHGTNVADALLDFAAQNGISTLVLGRTRERPLARMFNRTLTQQLLQRGAHYELVIVSSADARARARQRWRHPRQWLQRYDLVFAAIAAAGAVGVAWLLQRWTDINDLSMVFIVAVVLVASRTRMAAAVVAALLSFVAYNFFFIEPRFTLQISARQGVVTVCMFLIAALVAGRLASRLRSQVLALRAANAHANVLQALARQLSTAADLGQVLEAGRRALATALDADVWLRLEQRESDAPTSFGALDRSAADWTQRHGQPAGRFTDTLAGAQWWCLPVRHERGTLGVAALRFRQGVQRPGLEQRRLAEAMVEDIGQAALRTRLVADLEGARVSGETERLRSALLSSVSHDLRSPLASMIGSASSLASYGDAMDAHDRHSLLDTIQLEGERLDRYIQNLLDMTRLGHTGLTVNRDWIGVDELIGSATRRLQRYQPDVRLQLDLAADLPAIWCIRRWWNRPSSTCWKMRRSSRRPASRSPCRRRCAAARCRSTSATRGRAFPKTSARASSTCSTAWNAATVGATAPAWALPSARHDRRARRQRRGIGRRAWSRHHNSHYAAVARSRRATSPRCRLTSLPSRPPVC